MKTATISFLFLILTPFLVQGQYTETINSNRPGTSQGAFAVGPDVLQLEAGGLYGGNDHILLDTWSDLWGVDYTIRYGFLMEELEVNLEGTFLNTQTSYYVGSQIRTQEVQNFERNRIGVKYLIYDPYKYKEERKPNLYSWNAPPKFYWSDLIPAISVYGGINFSFGDNPYLYEGEGNFSPRVALITQNNWGPWVLVLNIIADKVGMEYPTYSALATLTHSFNQRFAVFTEFQTLISDVYSDEIVRAGLAYLLHQDLQADVSGLYNLKHTPSRWEVALGLSYRFDWHSQDQYLDLPEDGAR